MINEPPRAGERTCPQCGTQFRCGVTAGDTACWCFALPPVMPVRADSACLCPECLRKATDAVITDAVITARNEKL